MGKSSVCYSCLSRSYLAGFWLLLLFSITSLSSHAGRYERYVVGTVKEVRDGDTVSVWVANTDEILKVRLYGINAPGKNKPFYMEATQYLESQVLGKHVDLYITGKGKFPYLLLTSSQIYGSKDNRYIAKVYHNDKYIDLMLASSGLATHYKFLKDTSFTCSPVASTKSKERILLWLKLKQGGVVLRYGTSN